MLVMALLSLAALPIFAAVSDVFSIYGGGTHPGYRLDYKINDDGRSVTLIKSVPVVQGAPKIRLDGTVTHDGVKFTITGFGDGEHCAILIAKPDIVGGATLRRINDYAMVDCGSCYNFVMEPDCMPEYIGTMAFGYSVGLSLSFMSDCEVRNCGGIIKNLTIGNVALKGDGTAMFRTCEPDSIVRCTSSMPPRIDTPLFSEAEAYGNAFLIVPDGAKELYVTHEEWSKFIRVFTESEYVHYVQEQHHPTPGPNEFYTLDEQGSDNFLFRVNDDGQTVTLLFCIDNGKLESLDPNEPVVDPATGRSYRLSAIGDGERHLSFIMSDYPLQPFAVNDGAYELDMPKYNNLTYIGKGNLGSCLLNKAIYINDGCHFAASPSFDRNLRPMPRYIRIGKDVRLSGKSYVFRCEEEAKRYPHVVLRALSETPVDPDVPLFNLDEMYQTEHSTLYVPEGALEAYRNHNEWGRFEDIIETALPVDSKYLKPAVGSGHKFSRDVAVAGRTVKVDFGVNPDGKTATLLAIDMQYDLEEGDLGLDKPVVDPVTGSSYEITAIGDGSHAVWLPVKFKVTPNIRQLNSEALTVNRHELTIGRDNNLEYIGDGQNNAAHAVTDSLFVNDGCDFRGDFGWLPLYTRIGAVESLGRGNSLFYRPSEFYNVDLSSAAIECRSACPPVVVGSLFGTSTWYSSVTLYVPKGCKEVYGKAPEWRDMKRILETEYSAIDSPVADAALRLTVEAVAGGLRITAPESTEVTVCDLAGRTVSRLSVSPDCAADVCLPAGFYIVGSPTLGSVKVAVR